MDYTIDIPMPLSMVDASSYLTGVLDGLGAACRILRACDCSKTAEAIEVNEQHIIEDAARHVAEVKGVRFVDITSTEEA